MMLLVILGDVLGDALWKMTGMRLPVAPITSMLYESSSRSAKFVYARMAGAVGIPFALKFVGTAPMCFVPRWERPVASDRIVNTWAVPGGSESWATRPAG